MSGSRRFASIHAASVRFSLARFERVAGEGNHASLDILEPQTNHLEHS